MGGLLTLPRAGYYPAPTMLYFSFFHSATAISSHRLFFGLVACEILDMTLGRSSLSVLGQEISVFVNPTVGVDAALGATIVLIISGAVAGLFPAMNAAKVRPIEALRAE